MKCTEALWCRKYYKSREFNYSLCCIRGAQWQACPHIDLIDPLKEPFSSERINTCRTLADLLLVNNLVSIFDLCSVIQEKVWGGG